MLCYLLNMVVDKFSVSLVIHLFVDNYGDAFV